VTGIESVVRIVFFRKYFAARRKSRSSTLLRRKIAPQKNIFSEVASVIPPAMFCHDIGHRDMEKRIEQSKMTADPAESGADWAESDAEPVESRAHSGDFSPESAESRAESEDFRPNPPDSGADPAGSRRESGGSDADPPDSRADRVKSPANFWQHLRICWSF
jgi:hypothetical protein